MFARMRDNYGYINGDDTYHVTWITAKWLIRTTPHGPWYCKKNTSACMVTTGGSMEALYFLVIKMIHAKDLSLPFSNLATWHSCYTTAKKHNHVSPIFKLSDDHCSLAYRAMGAEIWSIGVLQYLAMNGPNHPLTRKTWPGLQGCCRHLFVYQVHLGRGCPEVSA